jgi:hypothetical protein
MAGQQQVNKNHTWTWAAVIIAVLAAGGYIGWQYFKKDLSNVNSKVAKPLLTDKLKKMVLEASDSLYHIEYDKFDLNIDSGRGIITGFKLIPDSAVYRRLLLAHKAPNNVMHIRTDSLIINNFGFAKTAVGKRFNIASLVMKHPVVRIVNKRLPNNNSNTANKSPLLVTVLKDLLKITSVQKMVMSNLNFTWVNQNEVKEKSTTFEHWNVRVNGFNVDQVNAKTKDTTGNEKSLFYKVKLFQITTPDSLYHIDFEGFSFSPMRRNMAVARVEVKPRLSKPKFYNAVNYDKDRIHLIYNNLTMRDMDIVRIINRQQFHIGSVVVGSFWGEVLNNYNWPKRIPPLRPDAYPHQKLQKLAFDITIDTMKMNNSYFRYVIAARKLEESSSLFMTNTESQIYNITNNTAAKKHNPFTICNMQTRMMGAGYMTTTYKFNLLSQPGAFSVTSRMGPMNAVALNPLAKPLALMEVKEGRINKMYMHIDANASGAKGHLDLYYKGMKMNLLKRDDKADTLKKRGLLSFLANTFTPNDNPKKNGKFKEGPINVTRDPRDSFFGLLWKCTLDGMSSAMMGFNQNKEKPNENVIIKVFKNIIKPHKQTVERNKQQ